jgi:glycosyltransferase involved in cell wall biosynthesis
LLVHNYYRQRGGEDQVFESEAALLEQRGHEVIRFVVSNREIHPAGPVAALQATWNPRVYAELGALIEQARPDVLHCHNLFARLSPAVYYAAAAHGIPVVQTLHNYRLLCLNATLFRDGRVCEDCMGRAVPWPGVLHACYRASRPASAAVALLLSAHRAVRTWAKRVHVYVALTSFARQKLIEGGVPADRIVVKPNFVDPDPGPGDGRGEYALFVGRLSAEKGIDTLLRAWRLLQGRPPLLIVGDGPLAPLVAEAARSMVGCRWLGSRPRQEVLELMKGAQLLVVPSRWYEGFPMVIAEAYAAGVPVIASDLGSLSCMVDDARTGLRFRAGDPDDLASKAQRLEEQSAERRRMGAAARAEFEANYCADVAYRRLLEVYRGAADRCRSRG